MAPTEEQILAALANVIDPDLNRDIVSLGFIKNLAINGGTVSFQIELTTPACPMKDQLKSQSQQAVAALEGVERVEIEMTAQVRGGMAQDDRKPLAGVANVIPVASGKGGVGKSTLSANLAVALAATGARVGLIDADIYGPSIPTIMGAVQPPRVEDERLYPVEAHGVKFISMGFFIAEQEAVVWRGPMLVKMLDEFMDNVEWGELDYLLVDLPPGTGDIQLSLCQKIPLTGAVVVSTPQDVALKVAQKAITLFEKLKTPVLGLVENMSFFSCPHCGEREDIFGTGGTRRAAEALDLPFLGELPLTTAIREASDSGKPLAAGDDAVALAFRAIAENLAAQASIRNADGSRTEGIKLNW